MHVFSRLDTVQETQVVADEVESVFLKTETAIRDAFGKFMNSRVDSVNEAADLNYQKN